MFYIRSDANSFIGSGHVMRCIAIANSLKKVGIESVFITADRESEKIINSYGYSIICLDSIWNQLEYETDTLSNLIVKNNIDKILIDSYYVTEKYLMSLRQHTKIIYMDDLSKFIYPVDVLINYNIYAKRLKYKKCYSNMKTKLLLGCEYVPLREEFRGRFPIIREKVLNVLISTGGTDTYNLAGKFMEYIIRNNKFRNIVFHIVVGNFNKNKEMLNYLAEMNSNIILHYNVTRMSDLIQNCDVALSAGGSTLYELCACGIPSISYTFADNQLMVANEFSRQNIIYYVGDIRGNLDKCLENIEKKLEIFIKSKKLRKNLSFKMQTLVDGFGANRIIKQI